MSNSYELNEVLHLVDEEQARLRRLIGSNADIRGVRSVLEQLALRCWREGARKNKPLPKGVRDRKLDTSQRATPIVHPRAAIEHNVTEKPVNLDDARRQRRRP